MNRYLSLYKYKYLIEELVIRDIKKKYRRSILGVVWSMLNPLLTMSITAMVFSTLFRFDIDNYPLYLLTGQILFTFYAESTGFAMSSIIDNACLIKKVYVPKYLFPISRVISSCINLLFTLPALIVIIVITGHNFTVEMFSFILPLFLFFLFCIGIGLILATMAVYFRDVFHLYGVFINLLSYATPIFYPEKIVPQQFFFLIELNPLYYFFQAFRMSIYQGILPSANIIGVCTLIAIITFVCGCLIFKKYQNNFILYI